MIQSGPSRALFRICLWLAITAILLIMLSWLFFQAKPPGAEVGVWLTTADGTNKLAAQPSIHFSPDSSSFITTITIDEQQRLQQIDGFGAAMTDTSAWLMGMKMDQGQRGYAMREDGWQCCKNILCVRPDNMGDVLMTTPAFRAIKETLPGVRLTLLGSPGGAGIVPLIPEIDEVISCKLPWESKEHPDSANALLALIDTLRKRAFDGAIIFTNYSQSAFPAAFLCYLANIPKRLAYAKEYQARLLTDWVIDQEPYLTLKHGVQRQLDLVAAVGFTTTNQLLSLRVAEEAIKTVRAKLEQAGVDINQPFIVVHPGASDPKRQYPPHLYAQAIQRITQDMHYQVVISGVTSEIPLSDILMKGYHQSIFSLVGRLDISELAAIIAMAQLLISNNTGPVHIAAAVQTPVVDLYARTNPEHTPWKVKNRVLYFDVPQHLRNKTPVLAYTTPIGVKQMPTPSDIVYAVHELLTDERQQSKIAEEVTKWQSGTPCLQGHGLAGTPTRDL